MTGAWSGFLGEYRALNTRSKMLLVGVGLVAVAVIATSVVALVLGPRWAVAAALLLGFVIWVASSKPIRFPGSESSVSVSETFIFIAVMLFGPTVGALLAAFDGYMSSRALTTKRTSIVYSVANLTVSAFVAGTAYWLVLGLLGSSGRDVDPLTVPFHRVAAGAVVLALTHYVCNVGLLALMIWAKYDKNPLRVWAESYLWAVTTFLAGGTAAALAYLAVQWFGFAWLLIGLALALPIPVLIHYTFRTYQEKFEARARHVREINTVYRATIEALAMAVDAKAQTGHEHIRRVRHFSQRLGELAGLDEGDLRALDIAALLHDIGKLGVPEHILNKPGRLTDAELRQARMHPQIGAEILANVEFPYPVVEIVRSHHERWDGSGYPTGVQGDAIPPAARVLGLVDSYDSLVSDRPYRGAVSRAEALDWVLQRRGTAFESRLVDLFLAHVDRFEAEAAAEPSTPPDFTSLVAASQVAAPGLLPARIPSVFERIAEVNQQVATLCDISRRLGSAASNSELLAVLTAKLPALVPFTTCAIHLAQPDASPSRVIGAVGERAELMLGRGFRPGEGITGWVIANGQPMVNTSPLLDLSTFGPDVASAYRTAMVFPIGWDGSTIGAVAFYTSEFDRYTDEHICLVESLLDPMADALRHTLRHEGDADTATTDRLTGLPNSTAFDREFAREVARARRFNLPLSLLLVSIDGLGAVETSHGAAVAERVRRETGVLVRKHMREVDFVARYAEDTFAVLLVMTDPAGAGTAAQRLDGALVAHAPLDPGVQPSVRRSVGVASWPHDGTLGEELVGAAMRRAASRRSRDTQPANIVHLTERINHAR